MTSRSVVSLVFEGELESQNWEQFRDAIVASARAEGTRAVVLDLEHVTFFDSSAIRALISARTQLDPRGITIHLHPCSEIVARVVEVTGIADYFPTTPPIGS